MYSQLLKRIAEPTKDYYDIILDHKLDIIKRVKVYGQTQTATELGMSQTTLSNHLKLLNALEHKEHRRYNLYYITFKNVCKIGVSSDIANRLYKFSEAITIETWAMDEKTAKEAESFFKLRHKNKSLSVKYPNHPQGGALMIDDEDRPLYKDIKHYEIVQCAKEVFMGNVMTKADRIYLATLAEETLC